MKTGLAFSEHVRTERIRRRWGEEKNSSSTSMRHYLLLFFLGAACIVLVVKLVSLQLVQGSYYRTLSDSNRIRTQLIYAPRGVIFDRNHTPLVYNMPGFREIKGEETIILSREEALERLAKGDTTISIDSLRQYPYKDAFSHVLGYVGQITEEEFKDEKFSQYHLTDWVGKTGIEYQYDDILFKSCG